MAPPSGGKRREPSLSLLERSRVDPDNLEYGYRQRNHHTAMHLATKPTISAPESEAAEASLSDESGLGHLNASDASDPESYRGPASLEAPPTRASIPRNSTPVFVTVARHLKILAEKALASVKGSEATLMRKRSDFLRRLSVWNVYCAILTFWMPNLVLAWLGMRVKAQQWAWREKIGLISVILLNCAFVGFLTFGFNNAICGNQPLQTRVNNVDLGSMVIHGVVYHMYNTPHPGARGIPSGAQLMFPPYNYGGQDGSFLFQNVNGACKNFIGLVPNSDIPTNADGDLAWYFPCNTFHQDGSSQPNFTTPYYSGYACHTTAFGRESFYEHLPSSGEVYFTWDDIRNTSRRLTVYSGSVLDLDLLLWLNRSQVSLAPDFDWLLTNPAVLGVDVSRAFQQTQRDQFGHCLSEIIRVGAVEGASIGCITSQVVLYVSLVFILSTVMIKFFMALYFQWFFSRCYAASYDTRRSRSKIRAIPTTMVSQNSGSRQASGPLHDRPGKLDAAVSRYNSSTQFHAGSRSKSLLFRSEGDHRGPAGGIANATRYVPPLHRFATPPPPPEWQPFGYPLVHAICLVTAYSEGEEGLRVTLNSVATTEYPNSHKVIVVVCDGLVRGQGEELTTPEILLGMMKDCTIPPADVHAFSYVAVVDGWKRHNMAKVYAGFYDYGDGSTVPEDEQQRVPMMMIVKCGTPDEADHRKPGNRGKRDSQVIIMAFLRRIMFNERITELEYEIFSGLRMVTGVSPSFYEVLLMVDADTKVYSDSLTHMISAMVKDPQIMGLCGETRLANKWASWVTMIQVFEYFISHHLSKSFESVFGGVTCLPGCFAMYRIKTPKDGENYWVPILASPEVVEQYSEHVVETMHAKNLLLLGEDRFLSTVMLRTFPKRRQVFVVQAVCKTMVPEQFSVLLSQRRRWINSTMHNLMELFLVRDLCGTFCVSMQCVIFIELIGTTVLPAAITFTFYLIISSILSKPAIIPLILLGLILGLPAVLIILTAHQISYVFWLVIYLLSLPIWNFVLPLNAYWKFDDFSWGETRKTAGDTGKHAEVEHAGEFDGSMIKMQRRGDFEKERILQAPTARSHEPPRVDSSRLPSKPTSRYQESEMAFSA